MTTVCRSLLLSLLLLIAATATARATCIAGPTTLCLNDQRFKVEVQWRDFEGKTGVGQAVPLTSDTGYFWFFNNANVELVVKVLDGRPLNGRFWVFFGALSNVEYSMTVTDTASGQTRTYFNPSGRFASVGDTDAFSSSAGANASRQGAMVVKPESATTCTGTETSLCLNGGRFRAEVTWKDFAGHTGTGKAVPLTADTGYFWFFDSANVELVVKALDARVINGRFWIFYGALSNVEYEMTVTDTVTGDVKVYSNPSGRFASAGDTDGFRSGYGVGVRLDEGRAVSSVISRSGGTITATAAEGTVFALTIPRDALLGEETITMTPVIAIDGLPLSGGLAAAVDLAPAGLRLFQFATLTITPPAPVSVADEVTFAWRNKGEEFFLYPPKLNTSKISMDVIHFSGYGVGRGTAADQIAQQQRIPASPEDALSQRLQALFASRLRSQSNGVVPQDDITEKIEAEMQAYYDSVLVADLEVARNNCSRAKAIMPRALSWARSAQLMGLFNDEVQTIMTALVDSMANCYNESFDKCVKNNDPAQVSQLLSLLGQLQVLGAADRVDANKVERCARFELEFKSHVEEKQPDGAAFAWSHELHAVVPLTFSFATGLTGSGELNYTLNDINTGGDIPYCNKTTVGANSVFQVSKATIDFNVFEGGGSPVDTLTMEYDPGYPNFTFTITCKPPNVPPPPPIVLMQERWRSEYYDHHHSSDRSGAGFIARNWLPVGGAIYARRMYQIDNAYASESTILTLKHTPQ